MTEEHPRKRVKLEETVTGQSVNDEDEQLQREVKAGITHFVNLNTPGFSGILKQR
jgi:hypothetical protein